MQCYTQLIPPTAVTSSISLPFLSATANNLIVARTSLIQIYTLKSVVTDATQEQGQAENGLGSGKTRKERMHTTKLVLVSQFNVSGTVTALAKVKALRSRSGGELLLVALKDAKLSLVEWDPEICSVSTVSIHYYEKEDLLSSPWAPALHQCVNYLTVDPRSRCAALKFGARRLAILPFHQAGDDLVMDDFDQDDSSASLQQPSSAKSNGDVASSSPYASSFVLSLLTVDPTLIHPIHLAFLHGYREPTLGVLSSKTAPSAALIHERRDKVAFTVYTLDLEQRASTTLLSVPGLPYDIHQIMALPPPIGGALLVGYNEIIHVDQSGKANGIAVNEFAKQCSSYPLISENELSLKLEDCLVEQLGSPNGELLFILRNGELVILSFKLDGRTVAGLSVQKVNPNNGGALLQSSASCTAVVGRGRIFVGSEDSDSVVLGWSSSTPKQKKPRQREHPDSDEMELDSDIESEDENDLYAESKHDDSKAHSQPSSSILNAEDYSFRIHDKLMNLAPLKDIRTIRSTSHIKSKTQGTENEPHSLEMVAATGQGKEGILARISPELDIESVSQLELASVQQLWSFYAEGPESGPMERSEMYSGLDNVVVTSSKSSSGVGESHAFRFTKGALSTFVESDFESDAGVTIEMASTMGGTRIIQVLQSEVRTFDGDFSLTQILPLSDEGSDIEPKVIAASITEPFVLLLREDNGIILLHADDAGDLEEVEKSQTLNNTKWQSGSLYDDLNDAFHLDALTIDEENASSVLMFLLTVGGGLQIFRLPQIGTPLFSASGLSLLPPYLSADFSLRRASVREDLSELLVADLGDATYKSPYLILRSSSDDIITYWPYQDTSKGDSGTALQFLKITNQHLPNAPVVEEIGGSLSERKSPLRTVQSSDGSSSVFMPGTSSCVLVKPASSDPKCISTNPGNLRDVLAFNAPEMRSKLLVVNQNGDVSISQLPKNIDLSTGWAVQRLFTNNRICAFDYHEKTNRFVVGMSEKLDFKLPEDELHPEWSAEATKFLPSVDQDSIALVDPDTWSVTDTFSLDEHEVITCIKTMSLEASESTHERRPLVCVGTALIRGEDTNIIGCIYVFDIISVVPEPDHPETGRKLKLLAKVKEKGAVTAITQIGTEGFVLVAHGQKCLVRGLKEDGTLLPVAFLDTQCYVSVAKELLGTGLCMLGDAVKGLWFVGYTEDPYYLKIFGKGANHLEVVAAEYLPDEKELYILIVDADGTLHVHQYDPSNPKSLAGQRLLHLSSFFTGMYPSGIALLPRTPASWEKLRSVSTSNGKGGGEAEADAETDAPPTKYQVLVPALDGSLSLITPLSTHSYRTLAALQTHLQNSLPHPLGLNPKAYRNAEADSSLGGRAVLDGNLLRRWWELGTWKRAESLGRAGLEEEWELRALLEEVGGGGLGFL